MKADKLFLKSLAGVVFFLCILFISAGRINYWQGWLYAGIGFISLLLNSWVIRDNRELSEERSTVKEGAKKWDKEILGLQALTLLITYVVAGLDAGRFRWSPGFSWPVYLVGVFLISTGEVLFLTAQKQNKFFSSVVRIQKERGHTVCDTGIYKVVRHPAYFGMLLTSIGIPLVLGSLWSFIPCSFSIVLTLIRTSKEDHTLANELDHYREYSQKTPYKLLPYIW